MLLNVCLWACVLVSLMKSTSHIILLLETLLIDDNALTGNTDAMCTHTIRHFVSDCTSSSASDAEIECSCCTLCCSDENTTCNDAEWFGNHGGIWETGYIRVKYDFDEGMVSPLVDYDALP